MSGGILLSIAVVAIIYLIGNYKKILESSTWVFIYIFFNVFYTFLISINKICLIRNCFFDIPSVLRITISLTVIVIILKYLKCILAYTSISLVNVVEDEELDEKNEKIREDSNDSKVGIILSFISVINLIDAGSYLFLLISKNLFHFRIF